MLEIKHDEIWKFIRAAHARGEDIKWLQRTFFYSREHIQSLIKMQVPPDSWARDDRIRYLAEQGISSHLIAKVVGIHRITVSNLISEDIAEYRKRYGRERDAYRRGVLQKIRAWHEQNPEAESGAMGAVQRGLRTPGNRGKVRGPRTIRERMQAADAAKAEAKSKDK